MIDFVAMVCADVGSNCDVWCLVGAFGAGVGWWWIDPQGRLHWDPSTHFPTSYNMRWEYGGGKKQAYQDYVDAWNAYKRTGQSGPEPPMPNPYDYGYEGDATWLMRMYRFYEDAANKIGGEEKKGSIPAGKA